MMVALADDVHAQCHKRHADDADTIRRLQRLLSDAVAQREWALNRVLALESDPAPGVHWYVDQDGYCAACALPESNARHAARSA